MDCGLPFVLFPLLLLIIHQHPVGPEEIHVNFLLGFEGVLGQPDVQTSCIKMKVFVDFHLSRL